MQKTPFKIEGSNEALNHKNYCVLGIHGGYQVNKLVETPKRKKRTPLRHFVKKSEGTREKESLLESRHVLPLSRGIKMDRRQSFGKSNRDNLRFIINSNNNSSN